MTQPIDVITAALQVIGASAPGETIDSLLAQQAFVMLNDLVESVSNSSFMILSTTEIIAPIGNLGTAITIGPGAMIDTARPLNILSAFVRVSNIDYPVAVINIEQYELITLKQVNGPWPRALYYQSLNPIGIINLWPKPSSGEIHLYASQVFPRFVTMNDTINFPQGYAMWMRWSLAELLMPAYGKTDQAMVAMVTKNANRAMAEIKRTNMQPIQAVQFDSALVGNGRNNSGFYLNGGFR